MRLSANGVSAIGGGYALEQVTVEDIARGALGLAPERPLWDRLREALARLKPGTHLGLDANTEDLSETGWGLVLSLEDRARWPELLDALSPLLRLRRDQAGALYREPEMLAVIPRESGFDYLDRHQVRPGPAQPAKVPFYLLIVASPASVDWRFEQELRVQHAVGRVEVDDLAGLRAWAERVARTETSFSRGEKRLTCFATCNQDDDATRLSLENLARPLSNAFSRSRPEWRVARLFGREARKPALMELLTTQAAPHVLVTVTHGLQFPMAHPGQLVGQGAILCQEWPGPHGRAGDIDPDWYLSSEDLAGATVRPELAFFFGCYSLGTPLLDSYPAHAPGNPRQLAPVPFTAALAKRCLLDEESLTVAVLGHVDRAWSFSFDWPRVDDRESQVAVYLWVLKGLAKGQRLACAVVPFAELYTQLTARLLERQGLLRGGDPKSNAELAFLWSACSDARNFSLGGDPALRLSV